MSATQRDREPRRHVQGPTKARRFFDPIARKFVSEAYLRKNYPSDFEWMTGIKK